MATSENPQFPTTKTSSVSGNDKAKPKLNNVKSHLQKGGFSHIRYKNKGIKNDTPFVI